MDHDPPRRRKKSLDDRMQDVTSFDLSKLSVTGWLLSLSTLVIFAIAVSIIAVFGDTAGLNPNENSKGMMKIIAFAVLFLAVAWFVVGKFLLEAIGFPIVRGEQPRRRSPAGEADEN